MLNEENRALLVVPYAAPPPPRHHLVAAGISAFAGIVGLLGLFMAEYSTTTTVWLSLVAVIGLAAGAGFLVAGLTARRRFRTEMEPATMPVPVEPAGQPSQSIEAR